MVNSDFSNGPETGRSARSTYALVYLAQPILNGIDELFPR